MIFIGLMVALGLSLKWEKGPILSDVTREVHQKKGGIDTGGGLSRALDSQVAASSELLEIKKRWEDEFEERLDSLISRIVGVGKAVIRVDVTLNAKNRDTLEETVDPDSVVLKGQTKSIEMEEYPVEVLKGGDSTKGIQKQLVTVNNDLSRTTTKIREVAGGLERVSVAVLVDGVMQPLEGGGSEWVPRSPEELAQLENLIKNAIGFTEDRGDSVRIESLRFQGAHSREAQELLMSLDKGEFRHSLLKWSLLGLSLIFFFFFVGGPFVSWITDFFRGAGQEEVSPPLELEEKEVDVKPEEKLVDPEKAESGLLRDQIISLLNRDEEKAVGALSMWLTAKDQGTNRVAIK